MKSTFLALLFYFVVVIQSLGQKAGSIKERIQTSEAIQAASADWRKDSSSCLGLRQKIYKPILHSRPDSITKEQLFQKLGKPNRIQKFYSGTTNKNYVEYIYYVYKDQCPKISVEGYAIGFIFDESEINLVEIADHEYCG